MPDHELTREEREEMMATVVLAKDRKDVDPKLWTQRPSWVLCHEYRRSTRRCATVREMKEGPSRSAIRC
jgi:murein endopeptidase